MRESPGHTRGILNLLLSAFFLFPRYALAETHDMAPPAPTAIRYPGLSPADLQLDSYLRHLGNRGSRDQRRKFVLVCFEAGDKDIRTACQALHQMVSDCDSDVIFLDDPTAEKLKARLEIEAPDIRDSSQVPILFSGHGAAKRNDLSISSHSYPYEPSEIGDRPSYYGGTMKGPAPHSGSASAVELAAAARAVLPKSPLIFSTCESGRITDLVTNAVASSRHTESSYMNENNHFVEGTEESLVNLYCKKEEFMKADRNGDGTLDEAEMKAYLASRFGKEKKSETFVLADGPNQGNFTSGDISESQEVLAAKLKARIAEFEKAGFRAKPLKKSQEFYVVEYTTPLGEKKRIHLDAISRNRSEAEHDFERGKKYELRGPLTGATDVTLKRVGEGFTLEAESLTEPEITRTQHPVIKDLKFRSDHSDL